MNYYNFHQNAFGACEEMRGSASITNQMDPIVCPKPRRVGVLSVRPFRRHLSQQAEGSDSNAGAELLDIILKKESWGDEQCTNQVDTSPFFCGSPPVRAANPLIQDARFCDEKNCPVSAISSPSTTISSPSSASRKGGCIRMKFGPKPAAVRVEGFDCLNRDRQNSSIPAVA